jgi:DNA-binding PadR family transcriptional regulator
MMILRTLKHQPLHGYALAQHIKSTSRDLLQVEEDRSTPPCNA